MITNKLRPLRLPLVLLAAILVTGCRQSAGGVPLTTGDNAPDVTLTLSPAVEGEPVMGPYQWQITLRDQSGAAIDDAVITLRGDMNHAGMVPVESTATGFGDGIYLADFEWTMAGEWFVVVTATLPDGRVKSETFTYSVAVK